MLVLRYHHLEVYYMTGQANITNPSADIRVESNFAEASRRGVWSAFLSPRTVLPGLLVFVGYYLGAKIGFALTFQPHPVSVMWPPNSILLAALLLSPLRRWWLLLLAAFCAHFLVQLQSGVPLRMVLCWFISNCSEALIGAAATHFLIGFPVRMDRMKDVAVIYLCGALLGPFLSSFLDSAFVSLNRFGNQDYWRVWQMRFCSNVFAALTFVPLIVTWGSGRIRFLSGIAPRRLVEIGFVFLGLLLATLFVFCWQKTGPQTTPILLYAPLPFLLWAAVRFGLAGTSACILSVAVLAIWGAVHGRGPFASHSPEENALSIQAFFTVMSLALTFLAVSVTERGKAEERFAKVFGSGPDAIAITRVKDGSVIDANERWLRMFGYPRAEIVGQTVFNLNIYPSLTDRQRIMDGVSAGNSLHDLEMRLRTKTGELRHASVSADTDEINGEKCLILIIRDVTDRKRAEEFEARFETLMAELQARFLNMPDARTDAEINDAIQRVAEFLNLDEGLLVQWSDFTALPRLTHFWSLEKSIPQPIDSGTLLVPWHHSQTLLGKILSFSRVDDLPIEAEADKKFFRSNGVKSGVSLPLKIAGRIVGALAFASARTEVQWPDQVLRRLQVIAEVFASVLDRKEQKLELENQLRFESLLNEISSGFVNVQADRLDDVIEDAQRVFCEVLGLDRSALFQSSEEGPGTMLLTHLYLRPGIPVPAVKIRDPVSQREIYVRRPGDQTGSAGSERLNCREVCPWFYEQLRAGQTVVVPDVAALGEEAAQDREFLTAYGTKSTVAVPLFVGGAWLGFLTFAGVREHHAWTGPLVKRFQFIADLFANALARKRDEDSVRQSEARVKLATDSAGAGLWSVELQTRRVWFSARMREIFRLGTDREATIEALLQIIHPEDRGAVIRAIRRAVEQRTEISLEHRIVLPDGIRWISDRGRAYYNASGRPERMMGASVDITERRQAQQRLEESEQRFRQMAENIGEVFYVRNLRAPAVEYVSPVYEEVWGRSCQSLYENQDSLLEAVHPEDRQRVKQAVARIQTGELLDEEYRIVRPDGSIRWVRDRAFPVFDGPGNVIRVTGIAEDITPRREAESLLRESEVRFRTVTDSAPVLMWMSGPDKLCTFVNKTWLDFTGRTAGQELGRGWTESVHADDLASALKTYDEAHDARRPFTMQYRLRGRDGLYRWVADRGVPRFNADGTFAGYIGSCADITEQHLAEEALRQSEERFRQVAENVGDFIWEVDATGLYTYTSRSVEKILGYKSDELVGKMHFYDLFAPDAREKLKTAVFHAFAEKQSFRTFSHQNVRKEGTRVLLETSGAPILDASGNLLGYRGADTDVTDRKVAEDALHQSWNEIKHLKDRLQMESEYLRTEIKLTQSFGEIIGQSEAVKKVLHEIEQVAPADCPVLIVGETGTGKELIARAIHRLSRRSERAMVKVNCAALPSTLVESELFGRERGAFTGAMTSQAGRFEIADGSTIFLDEIGELSPEVQVKLLRVLQEGEFERLGSPNVRKVDVRVIAATNRNLVEEVRQGRFRQDLYYRLSVFPIQVPPLRERTEDIPVLVSAFVTEFASRMGKKVTKLPRRTMDALLHYSWPGNIRQLRNVLEHGVILSSNEVLRIPPLTDPQQSAPQSQPMTLTGMEREHIIKTLEKTRGRIKGAQGAAKVLGLNPATLYSRMRKLGIPNSRQRDDIQPPG